MQESLRVKGGIPTCKILPKSVLEFNRFKRLFCPEIVVEISQCFNGYSIVKLVTAEFGLFRQGIAQEQFISTSFLVGEVFDILTVIL